MFKLTKPIIAIYSTLILLSAIGAFVAIIALDDTPPIAAAIAQEASAATSTPHVSKLDTNALTAANQACDKAVADDTRRMPPPPAGYGKPERDLLVAACVRLVLQPNKHYEDTLAAQVDAQYAEASHSLNVDYDTLRTFYRNAYKNMMLSTQNKDLRPYYAAMANTFTPAY